MKKSGRYDTTGLQEDTWEPGSNGTVLHNLLAITSRPAMDRVETKELVRVT